MNKYQLIHSAKGSSWEKKDHKYIFKKVINGATRYFYDAVDKAKYVSDAVAGLADGITDEDLEKWDAIFNEKQWQFVSDLADNKTEIMAKAVAMVANFGRDKNFLEKFKKKDEEYIGHFLRMDHMKKIINPSESSTNCVNCVTAIDMRARGYDVEAKADNKNPYHVSTLGIYKNPNQISALEVENRHGLSKSTKVSSKEFSSALEKDMLSHGDGAYGHLSVKWKDNDYGHDLFWINNGNRVIVYDGQNGDDSHSLYEYTSRSSSIEYFRSDNLELNPSVMDYVQNKK